MFMAEKNFGAMEFAVSRAIRELHQHHEFISTRLIADHIGCDRMTVQRSIRRLIRAGLVIRGTGSTRAGGYRYEYIGNR